MSASGGGAGGNDRSGDQSDHPNSVEATFTRVIGQKYYDIAKDIGRIEQCLYHPSPDYRVLAIRLCADRVDASAPARQRIVELAHVDPSEIVRSSAIMAMCSLALGSETKDLLKLLKFFAGIALNENEPDLVRMAAYQSAVLFQPHYERVRHIARYIVTDVTVADFDMDYLKTVLDE